jgi:restriction endonuclease S subunit
MSKSSWTQVHLDDVAEIIMGQAPPGDMVSESGVGLPFLQGNAEFGTVHPEARLVCRRPAKSCEEGDLLVSVRAPVGALNLADRSYGIGRGLAAIRFKGIDADYGRYSIQTHISQLGRVAQGTTFEAVGQRELSAIRFPIPEDAREQREIAQILAVVDKQIQSTEALLRKIDLLRNGAIRYALAIVMRDCRYSTVDSLFTVKPGITLGPHRLPRANACKYLRVANVQRGRIDLSDIAFLDASPSEQSEFRLVTGDLLVVEGHANPEEIGRCALVGLDAVGLLYQNHLFRLRSTKVEPEFAELWLNSDSARTYWLRMCATSSGLYTINSRMLKAMPFPVLSPEHQADVVNAQRSLMRQSKDRQGLLAKLRLVRQGLMDDLLTGRVRVANEGSSA